MPNEQINATLIEGPVNRHLVRLTLPMIVGILSLVMLNMVDAYFVGRLGTGELAAMGFTFPVVLLVGSLAIGIGFGGTAVISRALGQGNEEQVRRLTTDALTLAISLVAVFVVAGFLTIEPLFVMLGAKGEVLQHVREYMETWYAGMLFVVVPMVGNSAIRASGDTFTPALIMVIAMVVNTILDPLLIFGIGPFPRLEVQGAALATVFTRATTMCVSLYILHFRKHMLTWTIPRLRELIESWKLILYIGLPTAATRMAIPVATGTVTGIMARFGSEAVAAFGVALRLEFFSLSIVQALSTALGPFVGQNLGAGRFDRLRQAVTSGMAFALGWHAVLYGILFFAARPLAVRFNADPRFVDILVEYIRIVPIGFAFQGVVLLSVVAVNVLHKPFHGAGLVFVQMFVLYIPLSFAGAYVFGVSGVLYAILIAYVLSGAAGYVLFRHILAQSERTLGGA